MATAKVFKTFFLQTAQLLATEGCAEELDDAVVETHDRLAAVVPSACAASTSMQVGRCKRH